MIIRRLTHEDLVSAVTLHGVSFEAGWSEDSLKSHFDNDLCLGVFAPDLAGFIVARLAADQAEIITIAVDPKRRGQGIGQKLMQQAFTHLCGNGVDLLFLEVAEDNFSAITLYKKCGFNPIGKRPAYYRRAGGRVAALTFRKDL
ncbi:MAG: ribosomal protein S18-alanine N-acetyltransferase [Maricaulaceae bacterium]